MKNHEPEGKTVASCANFWLCENCGSQRMRHVEPEDDGQSNWQNCCLACGHHSEYLPSPEEIAYETAKIRAETGRLESDDDHEKFWHAVQAQQLDALDDDEGLDLTPDDLSQLF